MAIIISLQNSTLQKLSDLEGEYASQEESGKPALFIQKKQGNETIHSYWFMK